ncbi:MAG: anthranilate synthase component I family protein [Candidatus Eremiobacteraeota bacterium]|nr:anthranilate synthase component I family protein [Candidatus Eremiobacteraeota bacterium]
MVVNPLSSRAVALPHMLLDGVTPVAAFHAMRDLLSGPSFLLESAQGAGSLARSSVIGLGVVAQLHASHDGVAGSVAGVPHQYSRDVVDAMREFTQNCRAVYSDAATLPYVGSYGIVPFAAVAFFEPRLAPLYPDATLQMIVPAVILVFDHASHLAQLIMLEHVPGLQAQIMAALRGAALAPLERSCAPRRANRVITAERYPAMVVHAQRAIQEGEVFQVVLSQTWQAPVAGDLFDAYRRLRSINPSPYMYYLEVADEVVFGSSPEMLCKLDGSRIRLRPLAGTRPRPWESDEEADVERELRDDPKERAEHVMLVDLGRNDVGRVSRYGTVTVSELMAIERYSHVMHLVSEIQGTIAPDRDAFDLFAAAFPAGTVSGAPKIRALELIAQLEGRSRGIYGGSIARFGFDGSLDACIVLRSAQARSGVVKFSAGAGIVADSVARREDDECQAKAAAVARALGVDAS